MMQHNGTVILDTERLVLRRFTIDDADAMFVRFFSDPVAVGYSRWQTHDTIETTRALMVQYEAEYLNLDC